MTTLQKRPANCGTGFCSCIECLYPAPPQASEPAQGFDTWWDEANTAAPSTFKNWEASCRAAWNAALQSTQPVAQKDHYEQHLDMVAKTVAQPLTEPEIHALAHRKATRYTYTAKPSEVMYGFSESHIMDFVRAIEKERGL